MKFTLTAEQAAPLVKRVAGMASDKPGASQAMLIEVKAGRASFIAHDYASTMGLSVPVEIDEPGMIWVRAKPFAALLGLLNGKATVYTEKGPSGREHVVTDYGPGQHRLFNLPGEFLGPSQDEPSGGCVVSAPALRGALEAASGTMNEMILLTPDGPGKVAVVGTDGYGMAVTRLVVTGETEDVRLHAGSVGTLMSFLVGMTGDVRFGRVADDVVFKTDHDAFHVRQPSRPFPNWRKVLPADRSGTTLPADTWREIVGAVCSVAEDKGLVTLEAKDGVLRVSASGDGENKSAGELEQEADGSGRCSLRAGFFRRAIRASRGDAITLGWSQDPRGPVLFHGEGSRYVLMPMLE